MYEMSFCYSMRWYLYNLFIIMIVVLDCCLKDDSLVV